MLRSSEPQSHIKKRGEESSSFHSFEPRVSFCDVASVTTFQEAETRLTSSSTSRIQFNQALSPGSLVPNFVDKFGTERKGEKYSLTIDLDLEDVLKQSIENKKFVMVEDLPWQERSSPYRKGRYSGMVNRAICPHGEGVLILDSQEPNQSNTNGIRGNWCNGR